MPTFALIPIKQLARAKERLSPALSAQGRHDLALAMYRDVLAAVLACDALDGVAVVSRDPEVSAIAAASGAGQLEEPGDLNEALTGASYDLRRRGIDRHIVLVGDLPLASADEIEQVLAQDADVVVVPSQDGGTNALLLRPGAIEFQFGLASAARHLLSARNAGWNAMQLNLRGLGFDVDTPHALRRLIADHIAPGSRLGANTRAVLDELALT
jgi:2-phospho-L-lactate guanylyltransferase